VKKDRIKVTKVWMTTRGHVEAKTADGQIIRYTFKKLTQAEAFKVLNAVRTLWTINPDMWMPLELVWELESNTGFGL
jgi:hypothetical protein